MRVTIQKDYDRCSRWAANYIAEKINSFKPTAEKPFVLGLPTGATTVGTYAELVKLNKAGKVSFKNVTTFNMDEFVGLSPDHPESFASFMRKHLFDHIDIDKKNINFLNGMARDATAECAEFEEKIKKCGGVRLFLCGIGSNGHIAFNEPGSSLASRTRMKALTRETIRSNAHFFGGDSDRVPKMALTVGIGTIMDSDEILLIATGKNKAAAVRQTVEGAVSQMCTASVLQLHQHVIILCDDEAAATLSPHVIEYFNDIEAAKYGADLSSLK